ncbi:hypothetical protein [Mycobacterium angelicum]|nr:hypothetical protein [Mycobacterium angelicum]MCV7196569.1 hypothetical protein [Mycobacterium angelicum]
MRASALSATESTGRAGHQIPHAHPPSLDPLRPFAPRRDGNGQHAMAGRGVLHLWWVAAGDHEAATGVDSHAQGRPV